MLSIFKIFNNIFTSNSEKYLSLALSFSWEQSLVLPIAGSLQNSIPCVKFGFSSSE